MDTPSNREAILSLLNSVKDGKLSPDDALTRLQTLPFSDLGYAKVDYHRGLRQGANEVIYGAGKTPEHIFGILSDMGEHGCVNILVTRISQETADFLIKNGIPLSYYDKAHIGVAYPQEIRQVGNIAVVSGGTSDIPVCEEAAVTAETLGNRVTRLYDVGVAGIHRLLSNVDKITSARVVIAVAGMEGALASVVGGLVSSPVIAVPTSVGYGASFNGIAALLSMLNSCASGVSVVNIDNGFGAGFIASRINQMEGLK